MNLMFMKIEFRHYSVFLTKDSDGQAHGERVHSSPKPFFMNAEFRFLTARDNYTVEHVNQMYTDNMPMKVKISTYASLLAT